MSIIVAIQIHHYFYDDCSTTADLNLFRRGHGLGPNTIAAPAYHQKVVEGIRVYTAWKTKMKFEK